MQRTNITAIARWAILWLLVCGCSASFAEPVEGVSTTAEPDRPRMYIGEPLIIHVTVTNSSDADFVRKSNADNAATRILVAPDGRISVRREPPLHGDSAFWEDRVAPGTKRRFSFVAEESLRVTSAGDYRMALEYGGSNPSLEVRFSYKPADQSELRRRALDLYQDVSSNRNNSGQVSELALSLFEPSISSPLLCELIKANRASQISVLQLQRLNDEDATICLIEALPRSQGVLREFLVGSLSGLVQSERLSDAVRGRVARALEARTTCRK